MRKFWIPVILSLVVGAIVSAQSLIESATAAAGGSAAGVAGKQVSDGLDKVFGKMSDVTKKAAGTGNSGLRKTAASAPPVPEIRLGGQPAAAPTVASPARTAPTRRQASNRGPAPASDAGTLTPPPAPAEPAPAAAPAAPLPTVDDLKSLGGATREEVTSRMGKPASRITMSDDQGLVEIVSFKGEGGKLGSLRIVNGRVAEVRPVQ
ncbi:MAG: hypothetical protein JNK48_30410 [Bryobacterales bacterium]|nr:hypothetical protein [Bryobacterales bacterium]